MVSTDQEKNQELHRLVREAAQGNEAAFGQIYDKYFTKVYRFVFYRVNHRETAEDLVAETFVKAWVKISWIKDPSSFNGWIYQIARNLVIDHYRSRKVVVDINELENILEYEDNALEKTHLSLRQKQLLQHLDQLSTDQQIVIKLKYIDGLDNQEIAQLLDKTEGAIRVIQHRAVKELKKILNDYE